MIDDLTNKRIGKLIVIKRVENDKFNRSKWLCKCDCGNYKIIAGTFLRTNKTRSCGCLFKEVHTKYADEFKSTLKFKRLHRIWMGMKIRCNNKKSKDYKKYGQRGIKICDEWLNRESGFINFYNWAINNGYQEGLSIDRINNNGNYEPNNCRWATLEQQANNTRKNRLITYNNKTQTLSEWAKELKIKYATLSNRINTNKWSIERAFTQPLRKGGKYIDIE